MIPVLVVVVRNIKNVVEKNDSFAKKEDRGMKPTKKFLILSAIKKFLLLLETWIIESSSKKRKEKNNKSGLLR